MHTPVRVQVAAFFQSEHCPEVAKQCKKRKLSGSSLLRMSPHDIINEWEVSDSEEAERAALQVLVLQEEHPCPLAARWSVADVGDWFDHNSLGQVRTQVEGGEDEGRMRWRERRIARFGERGREGGGCCASTDTSSNQGSVSAWPFLSRSQLNGSGGCAATTCFPPPSLSEWPMN